MTTGNETGGTPRGAARTLEYIDSAGPILDLDENISVDVATSIAQVDAAEWDDALGDNVLASYGLLRALEETRVTPHASRYFLARGRRGILGVIAGYLDESTHSGGSIPV